MKNLSTLFVLLLSLNTIAQNVGIGTLIPDASALLEISATNKGLLIPRVTLLSPTDVVTVPTPAIGLLVINTNNNVAQMPDASGFYVWTGTWTKLLLKENGNATAGWTTRGNAGTNATDNFFGTTDKIPLVFKINNGFAGKIDTSGALSFGKGALRFNPIDGINTAFGDSALFNNASGAILTGTAIKNTAIGNKALLSNYSGNDNTAVGNESLSTNSFGNNNTAVGSFVLYKNIAGNNNTAMGNESLYTNSTGTNNVGYGSNALFSNTTGNANIAIGVASLANSINKSNIVAIGDSALYNNGLGVFLSFEAIANTAIGNKALFANKQGSKNTSTGYYALYSNTFGENNTANGNESLFSNIGNNNTAIGNRALYFNTTGSNNTAIGNGALISNTIGYSNVAIGVGALQSNTKANNLVAVGDSALYNNVNGSTPGFTLGINNTAIGSKALYSNAFGGSNTALGFQALYANNGGNSNVAIGGEALRTNVSGIENTATGYRALFSSINNQNTSQGYESGFSTTNSFGTYVGYRAGRNTNGVSNTYIGWGAGTDAALAAITTGGDNVCLGVRAGQGITTGGQNIIIGNLSNIGTGTFTNTIAIGHNVTNTQSNSVVLGNAAITKWGFGKNTSAASVVEFVNTTASLSIGGVWTNASDRNIKTNFIALDKKDILNKIMKLPITRWNYNVEQSNNTHIGPMAQDFYQLFYTGKNDKTISTIDPSGVALVGIQQLKNELEDLRKEVEFLKTLLKQKIKE